MAGSKNLRSGKMTISGKRGDMECVYRLWRFPDGIVERFDVMMGESKTHEAAGDAEKLMLAEATRVVSHRYVKGVYDSKSNGQTVRSDGRTLRYYPILPEAASILLELAIEQPTGSITVPKPGAYRETMHSADGAHWQKCDGTRN